MKTVTRTFVAFFFGIFCNVAMAASADDFLMNIWVGASRAVQTGSTAHPAAQIEILKAPVNNFAVSGSIILEGSGEDSTRSGIALQGWYVVPVTEKITFSAGAGPYIARESNSKNTGWHGMSIFSVRAAVVLTRDISLGVQLHHIVSGDPNQNMLVFGLINTF